MSAIMPSGVPLPCTQPKNRPLRDPLVYGSTLARNSSYTAWSPCACIGSGSPLMADFTAPGTGVHAGRSGSVRMKSRESSTMRWASARNSSQSCGSSVASVVAVGEGRVMQGD